MKTTLVPFAEIIRSIEPRHGDLATLSDRMPVAKSAAALRRLPDDRYLSVMSQRIFRAGLKHSMVDAKWPAFEAAFFAFDPHRVSFMTDQDFDRLMQDKGIIRHGGKIKAVLKNAGALREISKVHGGFGAYLADWPGDRIVELWAALKKNFSQLGGISGPRFLRMVGKDTFILTPDVARALVRWEVVDRPPGGKKDLAVTQEAFNAWQAETGKPLGELSMILALSA